MRRTLSVCRGGVAAVAAAVALAACGGSDDESASPETSAAETSAEPAESEFCAEAREALAEVEPAFQGSSDPATLAPTLQEAAENVRAIEPPAEISDDWAALGDGIEQFAQAFAEVDVTDPASASAFQQRTNEIVGELSTSATSVQTYLAEECGVEVDPTEPAAPTS